MSALCVGHDLPVVTPAASFKVPLFTCSLAGCCYGMLIQIFVTVKLYTETYQIFDSHWRFFLRNILVEREKSEDPD